MFNAKVRNWKNFQHFKDRSPPWIKLHREILDDYDINMISADAFKFLVQIWLLASEDEEKEGTLPNPDQIAFRLRLSKIKCLELLRQVDIFLISTQYQNDPLEVEKERELEKEVEVEREGPPPKKNSPPKGLTSPPTNFAPTEDMISWAVQEGALVGDVLGQTVQFLDYWKSKGKKFSDWDAAWRNWIRKYLEFKKEKEKHGTHFRGYQTHSKEQARLQRNADALREYGESVGVFDAENLHDGSGDSLSLLPQLGSPPGQVEDLEKFTQ